MTPHGTPYLVPSGGWLWRAQYRAFLLAGSAVVSLAILALAFVEFVDGGKGRVLVFLLSVLFVFAQAFLLVAMFDRADSAPPPPAATAALLASNACVVAWTALMLRTNLAQIAFLCAIAGFALHLRGTGDYIVQEWDRVHRVTFLLAWATSALLALMALATTSDSPLLRASASAPPAAASSPAP